MGKYDKLLSPIDLGHGCVVKNRIMKAPQSTWLWNEDGTANGSRAVDMYEGIAAGGTGLIEVSAILWEPAGTGIYLMADTDDCIPGIQELTSKIHAHGAKCIGQLHHMGPSAWGTIDGGLPISASSLTEDEIPTPPPFGRATRGISVDEIHEKQQKMIDAAYRLKQGGFDGMEVHCAHGYFLNSWFSPIWNRRTDEYSWQPVENRTRIARELYDGIRAKCGDDFVIGVRINGQEFHPTMTGIKPADAAEAAVSLKNAGFDYISVAGYGYGPLSFRYCPDYWPYPEPEPHMKPFMEAYRTVGLWREGTVAVKKAVGDLPVITAGRFDEDLGEECLENGDADIIAYGRMLWADPEFANKVAEGRTDEIRRCTRCASCEDPVTQPRYCRVNPALGHEKEYALTPTDHPKNVMVIGGGPAGMEAAIDADARGHKVTLYEKSNKLGGRIELASMIKGDEVEDVMPLQNYLTTMIGKSGVNVKLKTEVTPELVKKEHPDVVIVATASPYYVPDVPGIDGRNVMTIPQMSKLAEKPLKMFGPKRLSKMAEKFFPVGKKIIIIGAGAEGAQGAEWLRKLGKDVVVVAENEDVGGLIPLKYKERIEPWFKARGVEVVKNAKLASIDKKGAHVTLKDGSDRFIEGDTVMIMLPERHDPTFYNSLKDLAPEVYEIGSTLGGDNAFLKHAIHDGRKIAVQI
ncbi:MAG: FAD-dependent oxidoreductase [Coriobacteriales bacterium]|jgi:2,4-dienoyl-CoA reductase (NADPH2)